MTATTPTTGYFLTLLDGVRHAETEHDALLCGSYPRRGSVAHRVAWLDAAALLSVLTSPSAAGSSCPRCVTALQHDAVRVAFGGSSRL